MGRMTINPEKQYLCLATAMTGESKTMLDELIRTTLFRKKNGKCDFPYNFKQIIVRYKKIGYSIDVLPQTTCLVVNPIKVYNFAYLFDCTAVGRASE